MTSILPAIPRKPKYMNRSSCVLSCAGRHQMADDYCSVELPVMQPFSANKMKTTLSTLAPKSPSPGFSPSAPKSPSPGFSPSALAFLEKRRAFSRSNIDRCSLEGGPWGLSSHKEDAVRRPSSAGAIRRPSSAAVDVAKKQTDPVKTKSNPFVERTVKGITEYLVAAGETAENASFIVQCMLQENFLLDMELGGIIMNGGIDEFKLKTKQEIKQTLLKHFPDFSLTSSQQAIVIDRLLTTLPMKTLAASEPNEDIYDDAVMHALHNDPDSFGCSDHILKQVSFRITSKKCMQRFPEWHLTHSQKKVVVDKMIKALHVSEMATFEAREAHYLSALEHAVSNHPDEFESIDATLRHLFGKKFLSKFPNWSFTNLQKVAIVDRILKTLPIAVLPTCEPQEALYKDALTYEASDGCMRCPICMDPMVTQNDDGSIDTSKMWFAQLRKTEHWTNDPCGHACCRSCMAQWAETVINDQKTSVKCPVPGCSYRLWDQDLKELVKKKVLEHHKEHESVDHLKVLKKLNNSSSKDPGLKSWLKANARPCPECHVIVSRYEGCDVMTCVCGTKFCYACGFKSCQCKTKKELRPDIWKPHK